MAKLFALIDCNNFFVSCERIFRPSLLNKPVVVLSNNDGCVISRSDEAKKIGIRMGVPIFEIKDLVKQNSIHVFSSNYSLYGDLSHRVMTILSQLSPEIEIYSIDEAFIHLYSIQKSGPIEYCKKIQQIVNQWTGIPVSIGIAETKTLAKAANYIAKKHPEYKGVVDFSSFDNADKILETIPVGEIWGVGRQYSKLLNKYNITNANELKESDENWIRGKMSVNGVRTVKELNNISCIKLEEFIPAKKAICVSRSYGKALSKFVDIEQATANFASRVAQKLRNQNSFATRITVFIMTNRFAKGPRYVNFKTLLLPVATADSSEIIKYTCKALKNIYKDGYLYKKSGVIAEEIVPDNYRQIALWDNTDREKSKIIWETIDKINARLGNNSIKLAIQGNNRKWKMRQERLSPEFTTKWTDLLKISI